LTFIGVLGKTPTRGNE